MTDVREVALQNYLSNPCDRTRNALIAQHNRLIHYTISKYFKLPHELRQDAFQEGILGMCKAIESFNPEQGDFPPHAVAWVRACIQKWMDREGRQSKCTVIPRGPRRTVESRRAAGVVGVDGEVTDVIDTVPDSSPGPCERVEDFVARRRVRDIMSRFEVTPREAAIINQHICQDVPLQDIGVRYGVSRQRMNQIKLGLLARMEKHFESEENRR